ncbi:MAG: selenium metabolism-associated LysR family transcriptional regulator [Pseudomonadota bacterium]|nr:selenium metabolism-associated LysR family transcriptional regulator [Pseudomonadota bacterium]
MSDRRLQVFHTVARLLSFTKAADTLHMTQPAVTFQVRQLEEQFNTRLFDRTHSKVRLTEAGKKVFAYAEKITSLSNEMELEIKSLSEDISGNLIIGGSTTIAQYILPSLLQGFKKKYPELNIIIREANTDGIVSMIESSVIDLGIVEAPVKAQDLEVEIFMSDELVLIHNPENNFSKKESVSPDELRDLPFILREEGSGTRAVIAEYLKKQGIGEGELEVSMELGNSESIKGAVEANIGVSILSKSTIQKELVLKTLLCKELSPKISRNFYFVRRRHKFKLKVTENLVDYAKNYAREIG